MSLASVPHQVTLEEIERSTDELPLLGYTVFWSLAGIRVRHADLKDALDATGLSRFTPDLPTPYISIKRAIEAWIAQRASGGQGNEQAAAAAEESDGEGEEASAGKQQRVLVRAIRDPNWLVFALVSEAIKDLGLKHVTTLRVLYHRKNQTLFCTTDPSGEPASGEEFEEQFKSDLQLTQELRRYWDRYRDLHVAGDLTDMMVDVLHSLQAITLRPRMGTTYFVPEAHHDGLARMKTLLGQLSTNGVDTPFLCAIGVLNRLEARRQMARAVHESLMAEVDKLSVDLGRFTSARPGTVKKQTMEDRLRAYTDLRRKIETYADLMEMRKDGILEKLAQLRKQAQEVVLGDGVVLASDPADGDQMQLWSPSAPMPAGREVAASEVA
jgi:hypothetical protein